MSSDYDKLCNEIKFLLASMKKTYKFWKTLLNPLFKNGLFRLSNSCHQLSNSCSKSRLWSRKFSRKPPMTCTSWRNFSASNKVRTVEKIDQWKRRNARTEILMRLSEQPLELVSIFIEGNKIFIFIFLFNGTALKSKKIMALIKKISYTFVGLPNKYSCQDTVPFMWICKFS